MYLSLREKGHLRRAAFLPCFAPALHLLCVLSGSFACFATALRAFGQFCVLCTCFARFCPCFACFRAVLHALPLLCVLSGSFACFAPALPLFCMLCTCFACFRAVLRALHLLCHCFAFCLKTNFILQTATLAGRLQHLGCQRQACWLHLPSPYHSQCTHPSPSRRKSAREPC